jgi:GNAT superfamily N-acetyltransferase
VVENSLTTLESKYHDLYSKLHPRKSPLQAHPIRKDALNAARCNLQFVKSVACYELTGLAIHSDFQGHGIGTLLSRWGMDEATREGVPVFVRGEERGVTFYTKALGFKRL